MRGFDARAWSRPLRTTTDDTGCLPYMHLDFDHALVARLIPFGSRLAAAGHASEAICNVARSVVDPRRQFAGLAAAMTTELYEVRYCSSD